LGGAFGGLGPHTAGVNLSPGGEIFSLENRLSFPQWTLLVKPRGKPGNKVSPEGKPNPVFWGPFFGGTPKPVL